MFLMSSILFASALAVIPVLVHLLRRQKVTPIAWGAMQFLLETPLKAKRRRRVDNWLLMLVRMAILLLLALLLSRPVVKNTTLVSSTPIDVAVVIDHSLTMGKRTAVGGVAAADAPGAGTLFDAGVTSAERLSRMLPASATISIVLAEHSPKIITPTPVKMNSDQRDTDGQPHAGSEWAKTLQSLHQLKPGMTKADIPAAVAVGRELLAHGYNTRKLILIISDDQRSNWSPGEDALWKLAAGSLNSAADDRPGSIPIYSLAPTPTAGGANAPNISVRAVTVLPAFLGIHRPSEVLATLSNTGATDMAGVPVQLFVDGRLVTTQIVGTLPAGESTTIRFDQYFPEAGAHWLRVHADVVDVLAADNDATAAVQVYPKLPVLIVDGQLTRSSGTSPLPQSAFLDAALQAGNPAADPVPLVDTKIISLSQLTARGSSAVRLEDFPIVVLNDVPRLPREIVDRLADHVQHGNGLWIILGPRTELDFLNNTLGKSTLAPLTALPIMHPPAPPATATAPAPPVTIDIREPANPVLAPFILSDQHNPLAGVNLFAWWPITPGSPQMRTILATTTGDPLALEMDLGTTGGRVILWTTPIGNTQWNNLPLVFNFAPLVNETIFHLASGQNAGQPRQLDAGAELIWTGPASQPIDSAALLTPDGSPHTLQPQLRGENFILSDKDTYEPGLYELRLVPPPAAGTTPPPPIYYSVNIDRTELDPATLSPADLDWLKHQGYLKAVLTTETLAQALGAQQGGMEIWWILGLLMFVFLLLEVFMTRNLARQQSGSTLDAGLAGAIAPASRAVPAGGVGGGAP